MTIIHQNSVSGRHSVDDASHQSGSGNEAGTNRDRPAGDNSAQALNSSTVNISFQAELRLRAYQEQRKSQLNSTGAGSEAISSDKLQSENNNSSLRSMSGVMSGSAAKSNAAASLSLEQQEILEGQNVPYDFSLRINNMLSEVQNNIVQSSDSGYQYLVNVLHNNKETVEDQQQLQEIMRKEQFFLTRRKPFMQNSDFQSYSQVLNQFSNIVERQKYSL